MRRKRCGCWFPSTLRRILSARIVCSRCHRPGPARDNWMLHVAVRSAAGNILVVASSLSDGYSVICSRLAISAASGLIIDAAYR